MLLLKSEYVAGHYRNGEWIRGAAKFAAEKHSGQFRKDKKTRYINHPVSVANILAREGGVEDHELIAAGLLHDTREDTETTRDEIAERFGERVADLVEELTNDHGSGDKHAWQLAHELSRGASIIKIADKLHNMRDVSSNPPPGWSTEKKLKKLGQWREVVAKLAPAHPVLAATFEREYQAAAAALAKV